MPFMSSSWTASAAVRASTPCSSILILHVTMFFKTDTCFEYLSSPALSPGRGASVTTLNIAAVKRGVGAVF